MLGKAMFGKYRNQVYTSKIFITLKHHDSYENNNYLPITSQMATIQQYKHV